MLSITPDLIRELAESRGRQVAITLGSDGWEVTVHPDAPAPAHLTAIDRDGLVTAWMDGDELDDDLVAAVIDSIGERHLRDETGALATCEDGDWQVVLPADEEDPAGDAWELAYVVSLSGATEVVHGIHQTGGDRGLPTGRDLYRTAGGRWVEREDSPYATRHGIWWTEVTPADAAAWVYRADEQEIRVAPRVSALVDAARAARTIVDLVTPERRHYGVDPQDRAAQLRRAAAEDERLFAVARIVSDLLRTVVLSDVRAARGTAARTVHEAEQRNDTRTAARLGISRQTLADLLALGA
jgi:hypothetical protein